MAAATSSRERTPNMARPGEPPSANPAVNPERENTDSRFSRSRGGGASPSACLRQAVTAAATYSGRFMRPSILALHTPAAARSPSREMRERSFRLRSWPVPPGPEKGRRQVWAHMPRFPLREPSMALK